MVQGRIFHASVASSEVLWHCLAKLRCLAGHPLLVEKARRKTLTPVLNGFLMFLVLPCLSLLVLQAKATGVAVLLIRHAFHFAAREPKA